MGWICEGECMEGGPGDESLRLMRCHSCGLSGLYEALGWNSVCGRVYNLKDIKYNLKYSTWI